MPYVEGSDQTNGTDIAIIGMTGRFPGAQDVNAFWDNIRDGKESVTFFTDEELLARGLPQTLLNDPYYVKAGSVLEGMDLFDASFFGYTPHEAEEIDPQQRLFLECASEAIEQAGYDATTYDGLIGVYAGTGMNTYLLFHLLSKARSTQVSDMASLLGLVIGNDKDFLSTRVSYKLDLKGPSITVQTACSTSLVAVHLACRGLLNFESDIALAGGVSINLLQEAGYTYQAAGILSPDGHCRAFDARAAGTVIGSGVGVVVLKRLNDAVADGDTIYAVLKGTAVNNDGSLKVGYTAPSVEAQSEVILAAQAMAGISADSIGYIEAHGTGTSLGDPIEIAALTQAFQATTSKTCFCAIGSVKTNIGHLDAAAGVTGLIKTVLALQHRTIPPSLHFETPNPRVDFKKSPFYVSTTLQPWRRSSGPRRAGVSSFGIGGTNVHVVLEEAPLRESVPSSRTWYVLPLSAKTPTALEAATTGLLTHFRRHPDQSLADVAHTLQVGRRQFSHRRVVLCRNHEEACRALEGQEPTRCLSARPVAVDRPVTFLFPGQGAQHVQMASELYREEAAFREEVDRCVDTLIHHLGYDLRGILYPPDDHTDEMTERLNQTAITQPALFVIEYALARLWMGWGVKPETMIGHSIGEYVAACLAGVITLDDALSIVVARGRLIQSLPAGAMLAVALPERDASHLDPACSLAAINGKSLSVLSGPIETIDALEKRLFESGTVARRLHVSHAFHSTMVEPILPAFRDVLSKISLNPPMIPFISNVTGRWITHEEATNPDYWVQHLRQTVRFADGVQNLLKEPNRILLEVGPGETLSSLLRRQLAEVNGHSSPQVSVLSSLPHPHKRHADHAHVWENLGKVWLAGGSIDWNGLYTAERHGRVPLPTYPFERQRYWVEREKHNSQIIPRCEQVDRASEKWSIVPQQAVCHSRPAMLTPYRAPEGELEERLVTVWQELLKIDGIGIHDSFFELGGESLLAVQLLSEIRSTFLQEVPPAQFFEVPTVAGLVKILRHVRSDGAETDSPLPIMPRSIAEPPPLSFSQERLWFLDQLESGSTFYHLSVALRIRGQLDRVAVEQTFNEIVRRHESLRTTFRTVGGRPVQMIAPESTIAISMIDLSHVLKQKCDAEISRLAKEDVQRPFCLDRDSLMRISLIKTDEKEHVLLLTMHHIISDGWSLGVLVREFAAFYQGYVDGRSVVLPELPIQYGDYACWQRQRYSNETLEESLSYWKTHLQNYQQTLALPTDHSRPASQTYKGSLYTFVIPAPLVESLKALSRRENATFFTILLAAFQVLLYRHSNQEDFCLGTPVANRTRAEMEPLVGFFVNTLVLRADLSGDPTVSELIARVRGTVLGAQAHQDLPFEKLVEAMQPVRDLSYNPIFQVMFSLNRNHLESVVIAGLEIQSLQFETQQSRFDLALDLTESNGAVRGAIEYSTDLFEQTTIIRMAAHYRQLLDGIVSHPESRLTELPILTEAERQRARVEWNNTATDYPRNRGLHHLFEEQVQRTPDAVALRFNDHTMSYRELNAQADLLACALLAQGVGPDVLVGLCIERSIAMVVGLLGTLKAGGAYVPLDPDYPKERLAFMVEDANISILLTQKQLSPIIPSCHAPVLFVDHEGMPSTQAAQVPPCSTSMSGVLAYVIYTSGSTGRPKGVMISHQNAVNFLHAMQKWIDIRAEDRILAVTSLSFDIALLEFFLPFMVGAEVVLADRESGHDGVRLLDLMKRSSPTLMQATPATWRMLFESGWTGTAGLNLLCGGEALSTDLAARLLETGAVVWNVYGPTETTVWSALYSVLHACGPILIGKPIGNTEIYILDRRMQLAPAGIVGEIYIGGVGLARGYRNRPDLTADRFVPNPFARSGTRLYRTGDSGRWRPDGNIEFLGRLDQQVKIRGYRIEPGEIESRLVEHPHVKQAVVAVQNDPRGEKRLVGYVVANEQLALSDLREFLRDRLPEYMVPSVYFFLDRFPLTPNGKIDRKALPVPDRDSQRIRHYDRPRTSTEEMLAAVWSEVLGLERVGVHDNFFELGGDSILSIQMISRIRQKGIALTPRQLFQQQTIAELATVVSHLDVPSDDNTADSGVIPLTPIQQWFFELGAPNLHHWNQSLLLDLKRPLDPLIVAQVIKHLVVHHDALRLRFDRQDGQWTQRYVDPSEETIVQMIDLSTMSAELQRTYLSEEINKWERSLDITRGPQLRAVYFEMGKTQPNKLLLIIHHLVTDGISWRILMEDFHLAYAQIASQQDVSLPAKSTSYARWARRLVEYVKEGQWEQETAHWLDPARRQVTALPVDDSTGDNRELAADTIHLWLDEVETQALLHDVPPVYRTKINDLLLTALIQTLGQWSAHEEILVDLEGHGREDLFQDLDISRTVGWFAGVSPVRLTWSSEASLADSLKSIKEQLRHLPQGGIGYGLLRYLNPPGEINAHLRTYPASQVRFNYLGQMDHVLPPDSPFVPSIDSAGIDHDPQAVLPYELDINSDILGKRLHMSWTYSRCRYNRDTVERLSRTYIDILAKLIRHCLEPGAGNYTPSDFPLSGLDQSEIDRLFGARHDIEDVYPLTGLQQGFLLHTLHDTSGVYIEQLSCTLVGELKIDCFQQALQGIIDRHPILRTSFIWKGLREPLQVVYGRAVLSIEQDDWRGLSSEEQNERLKSLLRTSRKRGFDLSQVSLFRVTLIRVSEKSHFFVWSHHHILLDGWCVSLLLNEVFSSYEVLERGKRAPLMPSPLYRNYIAWLRRQDLHVAEQYWRRSLAGFASPISLAVRRKTVLPQLENSTEYDQRSLYLSKEETQLLLAFCQQHKITFNTVIQGVWALLLSRYSGEEDVLFGVTVSGRPPDLPGIQTMIGLFLNTLPLRARINLNLSIGTWLQALLKQNLEMREYEYASLHQIQNWSDAPPGQPLFESLLVFENYPSGPRMLDPRAGLTVKDMVVGGQTHYPLTLDVEPGTTTTINLIFDCSHTEAGVIQSMLDQFRYLLEQMVQRPHIHLGNLALLRPSEQQQLTAGWNRSAAGYQVQASVTQIFEAQSIRTPEAGAVVCEGEQLTYAELNARANQLAHYLHKQGVRPDTLVGICMERSVAMVVSLLGILKAGGAYIPIDPEYPVDRIAFLLEDATPALLLTQQHLVDRLPKRACPTICLDSEWEEIGHLPTHPLLVPLSPKHLAYTIYTSGSTGRPKGAGNTHEGLLNRLEWMQEYFSLTSADRILQKTTFSFDVSVWEFFWPLIVGARLVVARPGAHKDSEQLLEVVMKEGITTIHFVPPMLQVFLDTPGVERCTSLRRVICSGETLPVDLVWRCHELLPFVELYNLYGPTEASIDVTAWHCQPETHDASVPIGRPIANTQIYLLDPAGQLAPIGVPAELHIGGVGLARGYHRRSSLTADKFIPDAVSGMSGRRLYRTGDLARYRADGAIEYLGRLDNQVKLRGFRIELGEIEAHLLEQPQVREAVVVAREDGSGDKHLVAYVVPEGARTVPLDEVRAHLGQALPDYMVPAHIIVLDRLPVTSNGKVDRRALPAPDLQRRETSYVAPRTPTEAQLATIWVEVLKLDKVGVEDNFFTLGGHSLLAITLLERMRQAGLSATVRALFAAPTIAGLAAVLGTETAVVVPPNGIPQACDYITTEMLPLVQLSHDQIATIVVTVPGGAGNIQDIYPLAPLQEGILFHHLLNPTSDAYLLSAMLSFDTREHLTDFLTALQSIIDRHDILRTAVLWEGLPEPVQVVWRQAPMVMEELILDSAAGDAGEQLRARYDPRHYRLDVRQAPLLRGILVEDASNGRWLFQLVYHHLVSDHTTLEMLIQEVQTSLQGHAAQLPAPIPFRNFVAQVRLGIPPEAHEAFFTQMLADVEEPTLPFGLQNVHGDGLTIDEARLPVETGLARRVRQQARQLQVNAASVMHLAWAQVLARVSGRSDVVFGTVLFGRMQGGVGADRVGGMILNTLPIRINVGQEGVTAGVQATHKLLTQLLNHEHASLSLAQRCSGVAAPTPLFSALLNYRYSQDTSATQMAWEGMAVLKTDVRNNYPVTLSVDDLGDDFDLTVLANTPIQAQRICGYMHTAVEQVVAALESAPDTPMHQLDILPATERMQVLVDWNATTTDYPHTQTLAQLFEAQVVRTPNERAVVCEGEQLTYAELNARANQVAQALRASEVGPGIRIGLCLGRSVELLVGLLGILKAGAAYVPVEPTLPSERLMWVLQDAGVAGLLTHAAVHTRFSAETLDALRSVRLWDLNALLDEVSESTCDENLPAPDPQNVAYLIYTSGSTGQPKGVAVSHRALVSYVSSVLEQMAVPASATQWALLSTVAADLGHTMLFGALCAGRTLHLLSTDRGFHPEQMAEYMQSEQIDVLKLTPSHLAGLLDATQPEQVLPKHCLVLGGEALPWSLVDRIQVLAPHCAIINHYGPTETTVGALTHRIESQVARQGATVPLGRPLAHSRAYILDRRLEPVPVGVPGELYLGGAGLAQGYYGQPSLTAERFVPDLFATQAGGRLYRTGDQARYRGDGTIEFLGRRDQQVKLRGYRIELGEIETRLRMHPDIHEAVVVVRENRSGAKQLLAYIVTKNGSGVPTDELRAILVRHLPDYMVPQAFVSLEAFPLTRNGKLDRAALPDPETEREGEGARDAVPQTETEQILAAIWAEVLRCESVGRHDNFFELGGDSILSLQIIARAHRRGLHLTPKQLFDQPTVAGLASLAIVRRQEPDTSSHMPVMGIVPLTPIQHWFFDAQHPNPHHWNQAVLLEVRQPLELPRLTEAMQALMTHHDALRLRFQHDETGQWTQTYAATESHSICQRIDLAALAQKQRKPWVEVLEALATEAQQSLHLTHGPLVRMLYFDRGLDETGRLLLVIHHLVVDGVSWRVLIEDLQMAYRQLEQGQQVELPTKTTSLKGWSEHLGAYANSEAPQSELTYWMTEGRVTATHPLNMPVEDNRVADAVTVTVSLNIEDTRALLHDVPSVYRTEINDILLTALAQTLCEWSQQASIHVELEGHGREDLFEGVDISRTVGWFTTRFPVMLTPGTAGPGPAIQAIKAQLRRIPQKGIGYGVLRYIAQDATLRETLTSNRQPAVTFNYLGQLDIALGGKSLFGVAKEYVGQSRDLQSRRSDVLSVNAQVIEQQLSIDWTYPSHWREAAVMKRLAYQYADAVRALLLHCSSPAAGGIAASDFEEAGLTAEELNDLLEEIG